MADINKIVDFADDLLNATACKDYCPNGLQVQGKPEVNKIISGVTASEALIRQAIDEGGDAILAHHGYFWRNEDQRIVGMKRQRLELLLGAKLNLIVYHLPLDIHNQLGNNAYLGTILGVDTTSKEVEILDQASKLGFVAELEKSMSCEELSKLLEDKLGRKPLHISYDNKQTGGAQLSPYSRKPLHISCGNKQIKRIAWCSGAAQGYIQQAKNKDVDCYLSGEVSESTFHFVQEQKIHYYAIGHHYSETGGVQLLGNRLAQEFSIEHKFIDVPNPI